MEMSMKAMKATWNKIKLSFHGCTTDEECKKAILKFWAEQKNPCKTYDILQILWNQEQTVNDNDGYEFEKTIKHEEYTHLVMLINEYVNLMGITKQMFSQPEGKSFAIGIK